MKRTLRGRTTQIFNAKVGLRFWRFGLSGLGDVRFHANFPHVGKPKLELGETATLYLKVVIFKKAH